MSQPQSTLSESDLTGRWVRPLDVPPGHWKRQLSGKLRDLAIRGKLDQLKQLIGDDPSLLNKRGSHGRTFLFEAVRKNRLETVLWLLEQGADVHLTGCYNSESIVQLDPITAASFYRREQLIEPLVRFGASRDVFRAAFIGDEGAVEGFLGDDPSLLNAEDPNDEIYYSPLVSFCVAGGQLKLLRNLVDRGASLQNYDAQLLFIAAHIGDSEVLSYLLEKGVSPLFSDATLWMATNHMENLRLLVKSGLSSNQRPYHGLHPLMYACRADKSLNVARVQLMVELGAEVNAVGPQGRTALHYAARGGDPTLCQLLLDAGADPTKLDDEGRTPLEVARKYRKCDVVDLLTR